MPGRRQHGEGSLYQRGSDGLWIAVADLGWRDGKRDRRYFAAKTPEGAIAKRRKFQRSREDGFTMPKGRQPYVSEWMLHWLHNIARGKVEDRTWDTTYRQKVTDLIAPYFDRVPLADLDEEMIEAWHRQLGRKVSARTGKPLSRSTIGQCHRIMSAAIKVAVIRGKIGRNPASNVTPPKVRKRAPTVPGEREATRILEACAAWPTGPRWIIALTTGMRQGETLGLTWPRIDLNSGDPALCVEEEMARLTWRHGCQDPHACGTSRHRYPCPVPCPKAARTSGRKHHCRTAADKGACPAGCTAHASTCPLRAGGGLVLKDLKSESAHRWIPLGVLGAAALRRQWEWQMAARLGSGDWGWEHGDLVFTGPAGRPLDPPRDWEDWRALLDSVRLPHYRVHDCRHAVATLLMEKGVPTRVVQELLGHASPVTTETLYQHVRPKMLRDAADAIDRAFGGLQP